MIPFASFLIVVVFLLILIAFIVNTKNKQILLMNEQVKKLDREIEMMRINYAAIIPKAEAEAKKIIDTANDEIKTITGNARNDAKVIIQRAYRISKDITAESYDIASRFSKDVFEKMEDLQELNDSLRAYENRLKGYREDFGYRESIIMDELAQIYAFSEAAENLKEAREKTKAMAKAKESAMCGYTEQKRKDAVITFITDSFNNKVDAVLSRIKNESYDKLKIRIMDAYNLVNNLGMVFTDAKITKAYLENRLSELYWGVILLDIRKKEQEEQRRIRDEMREEEIARKEREKAVTDAAEKENAIKEALLKATQELEEASLEQKAKYEDAIDSLKKQLKEAEENNKRAQSMAELTKAGHVYVISNIGSFGENVYKIGMTRRLEPEERIRELGDASVPFPFDIHALIYSQDAPKLEYELHQIFSDNQVNKVNTKKEFFRVRLSDIKEYLQKNGIDVEWTMTAEAAEYRESLEMAKEPGNVSFISDETNSYKSEKEEVVN